MRRLRICLIFLLLLASRITVNAQKGFPDRSDTVLKAKNSVFVEFGGNAGSGSGSILPLFSINYDRVFYTGKIIKTTFRVGSNIPFGEFRGLTRKERWVTPFMFNLLIGRKSFYFESGIGMELVFDAVYASNSYYLRNPNFAFTSVIGFRYQKHTSGIMARVGVTPTIGSIKDNGILHPYFGVIAGASIGYNF